MFVSGISVIGRNTGGVRLMKLAEGEKVVAMDKVAGEGEGNGRGKEGKQESAPSAPPKKPEPPLDPIIFA